MNIVQIGCNNCKDHVFDFVKEKENQLKELIVVDVLPRCIESAKSQYSFLEERLTAVNAAIGIRNGLIDFFHPEDDNQSMHSSSSLDHVQKHGHKIVRQITVPCLNINDFLSSLKLEKIDYFFIDTEGMDVPILLEMDFDKYTPMNLQFEHYHSEGVFSSKGENRSNLLNKLKKFNYSISVENEYDTIARRI